MLLKVFVARGRTIIKWCHRESQPICKQRVKCLGEKPLSWLELIFSTSNSKSARKRAEHPFQPPKIMQSRGLRGIPSNSILANQKAGIVDFRDEIHFAFKAANLKIKKSVRATHFFFSTRVFQLYWTFYFPSIWANERCFRIWLDKVFFDKNNAKSCFVSEMFTSPRFWELCLRRLKGTT